MKVAGVTGTVRPLPGLRLKINLLLLAIQVPALVILSFSITRGIREMVETMARAQAARLAREINERLAGIEDQEVIQKELTTFLASTSGVRSAALFLADDDQLLRRAHWGENAPWDPDEDDSRAFREGRSIDHALEPPDSNLAITHRAFRNSEGLVKGVIRLELDQTESVEQVGTYSRQLFVGMVVIFGLTVLVLFGGMHLLVVSPVKNLVAAMGGAREGRLKPVAVGPGQDEIVILARSYNDMVHRLRAVLDEKEGLLGEVRDLNQNLQARIEEATGDLAKSHHDLERAYHDLYASQRDHERLERLASLGQVAREIAHEFATPLNVVSGTLQMLLEDSDLSPAHRERLARVLNQTERLIQICRDTLSPLKTPAPELRPADLNALVEEVGAFMAPAFAARGVEFRPRLAAGLPPVGADLHQMEQVLLNLISNALDALPAGGRIEVETRSIAGSDPSVLLVVRDDGVGIPADHLARIFDPFFTTKGAGRGTGLGLAICKDIIGQHRGEIRIESQPGHGSAVTVRLPALAVVGGAAA
jgi:signal transduction histidine kinase